MVVLTGLQKALSLHATKRHGFSQDYGTGFFGYLEFGRDNPWAGIYSRYPTRKGTIIRRSLFYWTSNPRTVAQQARRAIFATGVVNWQSFTTDQKAVYNKRARRRRMTGFNLYISEYLRS